jgi:hypothetical protein
LLSQQVLLKLRQGLPSFGQSQAEMLNPLGLFLQDHHVLNGGLVIVVGMNDER